MKYAKLLSPGFRSKSATVLLFASTCLPLAAYTNLGNNTLRSDGSASDTQAAINASVDGYTVQVPAGSFTWTSTVTISGKGIKLQGAGAGRVVARSATSSTIGTGTQTFTLTTETIPALEALKSQITNGTILKIWRTGGAVSGGNTTGAIPWMRGTVTSLVGNTLTLNITSTNSTGTHAAWFIATEAPTTIINNIVSASLTNLLAVTEDTTNSTEISDIRFEHASTLSANVNNAANFIGLTVTTNAQPVLIHDCAFFNYTYGNQIYSNSNKGVVWNCSFVSLPFGVGPLAIHVRGGPTDSWTTASTMGTADTTGKSNLYIEDCDFRAWLNATDFDDNARSVVRHCLFDNSGFGTHGADSSNYGQRHFEVYDSVFFRNNFSDGQTLNVTQFFLIRGGTGVITNNEIPAMAGSDYGSAPDIKLALWNLQYNTGPNPLWGSNIAGVQYPCPRQIGLGRVTGTGKDGQGRSSDSITYVGDSEPIYMWNNVGSYTVNISQYGTPLAGQDVITDYVQAGRDYFNNGTPKPGYTKYPYPHPLRPGTVVVAPSVALVSISTP